MCLEYVTQELDPPDPAEIEVWKILRQYPGDRFLHTPMKGSDSLERSTWYRATQRELLTEQGDARFYPSGFHCFRSYESAYQFMQRIWRMPDKTLVIHKIKARGVRTVGTQYGHEVLVVDEIMVPIPKIPKVIYHDDPSKFYHSEVM